MKFNIKKFSKDIWKTRNPEPQNRMGVLKMGLREAAKHSKVSYAAISRIERGQLPDMNTFVKLCAWMEQKPEIYFK